jgi:hypothetical protein
MSDDKQDRGHLEASHARRPDFQLDDRPIAGGPPAVPDRTWWSGIDKRHRGWILAGGVSGVVLLAIGIGVAVAMVGSSLSSRGTGFTPAGVAASVTATAPVGTTATTAATGTSDTTAAVQATTPAPASPLVAYRKSGAIWVADQDGTGSRQVVPSVAGKFALSPDGGTLAVIEESSSTATLSLVDVAGGKGTVVGTAVSQQPSWAPDSSYVVYTMADPSTHDFDVERVSRDGSGRRQVGPGSGASVAPDGSIVAVSAKHDVSVHPAVVYSNGVQRLIGVKVIVNAVAPLRDRVIMADAGSFLGTKRSPAIDSIGYDGSGQKVLVSRPSLAAAYFGTIDPSPDGSWIAYTETGDDGYSRMFAVQPSGGRPVKLSILRDDYILGWTSDGSEILFIEGNQLQGEPTRLMAVRPDGSKRRVVIDGAGL